MVSLRVGRITGKEGILWRTSASMKQYICPSANWLNLGILHQD